MYKFNTSDQIILALSRNNTIKVLEEVPEKGAVFIFRPITNKEWIKFSKDYTKCNSYNLEMKQKDMIERKVDLKYMEELDRESEDFKEISENLKALSLTKEYIELSEEIETLKIKEFEFYIDMLPKFLKSERGLKFNELSVDIIKDIATAWINESIYVCEDDQLFFD